MLLDLRPLFDEVAPAAAVSRPSGDEMYAYRLRHLAAMRDEEAVLALYLSDDIDFEMLLRVLKPN